MGELTEMIIDGMLCQECGGMIDREESGYPRSCDDCKADKKETNKDSHPS